MIVYYAQLLADYAASRGMNALGGVAFSGRGRVNGQTDNTSAKGDDELWGESAVDDAS